MALYFFIFSVLRKARVVTQSENHKPGMILNWARPLPCMVLFLLCTKKKSHSFPFSPEKNGRYSSGNSLTILPKKGNETKTKSKSKSKSKPATPSELIMYIRNYPLMLLVIWGSLRKESMAGAPSFPVKTNQLFNSTPIP